MNNKEPLKKARELILSLTTEEDAKPEIIKFEAFSDEERKTELTKLYNTAEEKAAKGDTKGVSLILRICDHFKDFSHDRMLLHYIAQAAANKALGELSSEKQPHHQDMVTALTLISEAFADANAINKKVGVS